MRIGELARAANCSVETVRYYEREGLLPPPARTTGNFRDYRAEHLERLRLIRNCRALDMSHEEIRRLLELADQPGEGCAAVNALFDQHIGHVDERIRELEHLRASLKELRERCVREQAVEACGILQGIAEMKNEEQPGRHTHLS